MSCGDGVERGVATCICKGQTVFEGAVIGQVFTGDVQVHCSRVSGHNRPIRQVFRASSRVTTAVVALALLPPPVSTPVLLLLSGAFLGFWLGSASFAQRYYGYEGLCERSQTIEKVD